MKFSETEEGRKLIWNSHKFQMTKCDHCGKRLFEVLEEAGNRCFAAGQKQHHIPKNCAGCKEDKAQWEQAAFDLGQNSPLCHWAGCKRPSVAEYCLEHLVWHDEIEKSFTLEDVKKIIEKKIDDPAIWKENQQEVLEDIVDEITKLQPKPSKKAK